MVLRRLMGWSMVDMTYVSVLKTSDGAARYDGKKLVKAPKFEDLPKEVKHKSVTMFGLLHASRVVVTASSSNPSDAMPRGNRRTQ